MSGEVEQVGAQPRHYPISNYISFIRLDSKEGFHCMIKFGEKTLTA
jgi:hypothetical protein